MLRLLTRAERILELLKEDEELKLAVAGLLNLDELLKGIIINQQELTKLRQDIIEGFKRHDEELAKLWREAAKLREDFNRNFISLDKRLDTLGARFV